MIPYTKEFYDSLVDGEYLKYKFLITGGGERIEIDDNNAHLSLALGGSSMSCESDSTKYPIGSVPFANLTLTFTLLDSYYEFYKWTAAVVKVYVYRDDEENPLSDTLVGKYRVTDIERSEDTLTLMCQTVFYGRKFSKVDIDDKCGEIDPSVKNLIGVYQTVARKLYPTLGKETACYNDDYQVFKVLEGDNETYRSVLNQVGEISCSALMFTHNEAITSDDITFKEAHPNEYDGEFTEEQTILTAFTGEIVEYEADRCVSDFIPVEANKNYVYCGQRSDNLTVGNVYCFYNANQEYIAGSGVSAKVSDLLIVPDGAAYVRFTVQFSRQNEFCFKEVDHVLEHWIDLSVSYPVKPTAIKYAVNVNGKHQTMYTDQATLTGDTGKDEAHAANHLTWITTSTAFRNHTNKEYDWYIQFDKDTGDVLWAEYNATNITWNSRRQVILGHGVMGYWIKNNVKPGDKITIDAESKIVKVSRSEDSEEAEFIIDITGNNLLANRTAKDVMPIITKIQNRLCHKAVYPFDGEHINFPFVEPFDSVAIKDHNGNYYPSIVTSVETTLYGSTKIACNIEM